MKTAAVVRAALLCMLVVSLGSTVAAQPLPPPASADHATNVTRYFLKHLPQVRIRLPPLQSRARILENRRQMRTTTSRSTGVRSSTPCLSVTMSRP